MTTTEITYRDKTYICRVLISNDGEPLIIAGLRLLDVLMPYPSRDNCSSFADKEAEKIDEGIFYYIADSTLRLSDDKLIMELKEANPEWFD